MIMFSSVHLTVGACPIQVPLSKALLQYLFLFNDQTPFQGNSPQIRNIPVPASTQYLLALLNLLAGASKYSLTTSLRSIWQIPNGLNSFTVGHGTTQSTETKKGEPNLKLYGPI